MSEEKIKILDMLKEGKITTEEAMDLLKQISEDDKRSARSPWQNFDQWIPRMPYKPDLSWINDLRSAIEETTRNALFPDEFTFGAKHEKFTAGQITGDSIHALVFEGKNGPMKLESYGGDKIEVEVSYKAKNQWDPHLSLTEESGTFSLNYDDNVLYMLGVTIRIPEWTHIGSVRLKNKNAPISIDNIEADKIELSTKNDPIRITDARGESLYCKTKNAIIVLNDVEMREIDAQTSYSKIALDSVNALHAQLVTNNAKIDVKNSDIVQLYAKTTDSPLRFGTLGYKEKERSYSINAITTNGQISIRLPGKDMKCKLRASTTAGGIFTELEALEYRSNEKNYIEAQVCGYETAGHRMNLNLQTTNYGIYIKQP